MTILAVIVFALLSLAVIVWVVIQISKMDEPPLTDGEKLLKRQLEDLGRGKEYFPVVSWDGIRVGAREGELVRYLKKLGTTARTLKADDRWQLAVNSPERWPQGPPAVLIRVLAYRENDQEHVLVSLYHHSGTKVLWSSENTRWSHDLVDVKTALMKLLTAYARSQTPPAHQRILPSQ